MRGRSVVAIAAAWAVNRLLHHAETIVIEGKNFRMKDANPET